MAKVRQPATHSTSFSPLPSLLFFFLSFLSMSTSFFSLFFLFYIFILYFQWPASTPSHFFPILISLPERLRRNQHEPLPNTHPLSDYISTRNYKIPILLQTSRSLVRVKCGDFPLFTPPQFSWSPDRNSSSESPVAYFFILPRTVKSALAILPL